MKITALIVCVAVVAGLYVRLAPSDPTRWHIDPLTAPDPGQGGVLQRVEGAGPDALARFETLLKSEPRTDHLAGETSEGRITYIARSKWIGFPDYITAAQDGDDLVVLSRLRFGSSDLGVNRARLERLLQRL
ncbi:MAG: DUF1499 domain-containing protein [Pseudomonadota bacterium]